MNLLDPVLGNKIRSVCVAAIGVVTAVMLVLQNVLDVLESLPEWHQVGAVAAIVQSAITALANFTEVGTKKLPAERG